jgi:hypothetical protein
VHKNDAKAANTLSMGCMLYKLCCKSYA